MRIISKFVDFYDSSQRYGIDTSCIYVRETSYVDTSSPLHDDIMSCVSSAASTIRYANMDGCVAGGVIFCGEWFPFIGLTHRVNMQFVPMEYAYTVEQLELHAKNMPSGFNTDSVFRHQLTYKKCKSFLTANISSDRFISYHMDTKCPVFLVLFQHDGFVEMNPVLRGVNFFKIKDSFTTFQDIYMFMSGVISSNENHMVSISDEDRIHKHGFDKWSFRKLPSKDVR